MAGFLELEVLYTIFDTLNAVRSELIVFCIAFAFHYILFRSPFKARKAGIKKEKKIYDYDNSVSDKDSTLFSKDPMQVLERSQTAFERSDHRSVLKCWNIGGLKSSSIVPAVHLAEIVESMQRFQKDSSSIVAEVTAYLKSQNNTSNMSYINRFLEPLAKSLDVQVVDAVINLLPGFGLSPDSKTFEILIQMRFTTRSFDEVSALVKQMKTEAVAPTRRTTVMLLKTALHTGKLDEALDYYSGISASAQDMPQTASEAPTYLATQLVDLACRMHRPDAVLPDLESGKVPLTTEMVNALLAECSRTHNSELVSRVEGLAARLSVGRDGRTYQVLVRNAGTDQKKIADLLDDMAANKIPCTQELGSKVFALCAQSGDTALADRLYAQLERTPHGQMATFQALLRFYAESGEPTKACKVFDKHLRSSSSDRPTLLDTRTERSLVNAALQCGRNDLASVVLESSPSDTAKHINIIRSCAAKGNLREAMGAFRSLQASGAEITQSLWNTVLDACVECQDMEQARSLMKEIESTSVADAVTYNTLIKAYLRNEDLESARGLMDKMRKAGCAPNHVTYNELINAFVRNERDPRNMQNAWQVVEEMRKDGVHPNRITCSILLKSLKSKSSTADINRAMELTDQMQEPMDEVLMSSVVEALVRVGRPTLLSQKLGDLHRNGRISINGAQTFGSLIKAYGHANDIAGAWRCWKEMRSRHVKPTCVTIGCMVEAVATSGDVDGAYELICQLLDDEDCREQMNAVIFGSVIKGYGRMKRMERVWAVFNDMLSHNILPSISTFNAVFDACARSGRMDAVPKLMEDMAKFKIKGNLITYSTMLKGFSQQGDMASALATMKELRATPGLKPDGIVYNTVLEGCAQAGLVVEGERLFKEMLSEGVAPTNYTLTVMVRLMGQSRRAEKAAELVEDITRKYRFRANSHVLNALIQACLSSRDLPRAASVFEQMAKDRQLPDYRTRSTLVRGFLSAGQPNQAVKVIRATLECSGQPSGLANNKTHDRQQNSWGSQDDAVVAEVLRALADSGSESASLGKQLLTEVLSSHPKVHVDPAIQRKLQMA